MGLKTFYQENLNYSSFLTFKKNWRKKKSVSNTFEEVLCFNCYEKVNCKCLISNKFTRASLCTLFRTFTNYVKIIVVNSNNFRSLPAIVP